mgnify:CR=1 FL=1
MPRVSLIHPLAKVPSLRETQKQLTSLVLAQPFWTTSNAASKEYQVGHHGARVSSKHPKDRAVSHQSLPLTEGLLLIYRSIALQAWKPMLMEKLKTSMS